MARTEMTGFDMRNQNITEDDLKQVFPRTYSRDDVAMANGKAKANRNLATKAISQHGEQAVENATDKFGKEAGEKTKQAFELAKKALAERPLIDWHQAGQDLSGRGAYQIASKIDPRIRELLTEIKTWKTTSSVTTAKRN